ncbi:MAG: ROK family protein [Anaerolineae bacterium]|nr:ROK family protein [Anaerolineae bacterium]
MLGLLALDFGGTKLAAAVRELGQRDWLTQARCMAPSSEGAEAVLQRMLALADEQLAESGVALRAIGISFDGPVDARRGCPRACHHVKGWEGFPLQGYVSQRYGVPVALENDATAAALGEWRYGAGRGARSMLYVNVGTGVGGGLVLDGALYRGLGMAGEIGHMGLDSEGPPCPCGRRGCLEALAAGPAIVRRVEAALQNTDAPSALRGRSQFDAADVSLAAQGGDHLALAALRGSAQALGLAIGNALNLLHLERVVLGGGVVESGADYLAWVSQSARERALQGIAVDLQRSSLGADAPLWGASELATALLDELG